MMKISELIAKVGDENIFVQRLSQSTIKATKKKRDGEITFCTSLGNTDSIMREAAMGKPGAVIGLVIWFPADKMPATTP